MDMDPNNHVVTAGTYDPNKFFDSLIEKLSLKNDAALSRLLEVTPPVISKMRHLSTPVGASMLIRMQEVSDLSIAPLRTMMGDRRANFRASAMQNRKINK
jgi:hypothetical protein